MGIRAAVQENRRANAGSPAIAAGTETRRANLRYSRA
jgi:hypothetical protein